MPDLRKLAMTSRLRRIGFKLAAVLVFFALLPCGAMFAVFRYHESALEQLAMRRLQDLAVRLSDSIDRTTFERYSDVQTFARHPGVLRAVARGGGYPQAAIDDLSVTLTELVRVNGFYDLLMLVDADGRVIVHNGRGHRGRRIDASFLDRLDYGDAPWFRSARTWSQLNRGPDVHGAIVAPPVFMTEVANVTGGDGYVLPFAAPVNDEEGRFAGVFVAFTGFAFIEDEMKRLHSILSAQGLASLKIFLLDGSGTLLAHHDRIGNTDRNGPRDQAIIGKLNLITTGWQVAHEAANSASGAHVSVRDFATDRLVSVGHARSDGSYDLPGLGWLTLVTAGTDDTLRDVNDMRRRFLVVIAVSGLLLVVIGIVIGARGAAPLKALTRAMDAIADGRTTVAIPSLQRRDEIGDMARALEVFRENAIRVQEMTAYQKRIVSVAAHEFRTPLAIIDSTAQRLAHHTEKVELGAISDRIAQIRGAVTRMVELVDKTLNSARLDEGRLEFNRREIDLAAIIRNACDRHRSIAAGFTIELQSTTEKLLVQGDPRLLDQVMTNLLSNAAKYSGDSRRILVTLSATAAQAEIAVRDYGIGIPAEEIQHLFTRFYRATTAKGMPGTGIGLHLVRELLQLHGATISVTSEVKKGSTFVVTFPRTQQAASAYRHAAE
jgi:signal transduction histidine kinase